jgi:hypothetical protein
MKRRPDEPELMGAQEASATLGVKQTNLRKVSGLPEPYDKVAAGTLWRAQEIRSLAFLRHHKRMVRPRKRNAPHTPEQPTTTTEAPIA